MQHIEQLEDHSNRLVGGKKLSARINGRFYTPEVLVTRLITIVLNEIQSFENSKVRIVDPFCGDGRLIEAFLRIAGASPKFRGCSFSVSLWDNDHAAVLEGRKRVRECAKSLQLKITINTKSGDSFKTKVLGNYDIVLTNPPWETLKPDKREIDQLTDAARLAYVTALRKYDDFLGAKLPYSQPETKFSGWGTNLSRCGLEFSLKLLKENGWCGIVLPSSLFCDQISASFRKWIFETATLRQIDSYPAESSLFAGVDQPCSIGLFKFGPSRSFSPVLTRFNRDMEMVGEAKVNLTPAQFKGMKFALPLELTGDEIALLLRFSHLPIVNDLCQSTEHGLWLGREWDETGYKNFTKPSGEIPFLKGRSVSRYVLNSEIESYVASAEKVLPISSGFPRIAWRDVSRRSQVRRMIATIIPRGSVTGNSLHVGYFKDDNIDKLYALLAIMNSLPFEFQLRSKLGTGHVSLGTVRSIHVPQFDDPALINSLAGKVRLVLASHMGSEAQLEVAVAQAYGLSKRDFEILVSHFGRLPEAFKLEMLDLYPETS